MTLCTTERFCAHSTAASVVSMLKLFNTATGQVEPFKQAREGAVSMYVCGPTVYGPPHLGHGRFSLVFDVLRRYLEWLGNDVTYVSNITDIDDKIIDLAKTSGRPWQEITREFEDVWFEAMDAIGVKRPTHTPHATEYVKEMVDLIGDLVESGAAYITDTGVYFRPREVKDYGLLARQDLESLRSGARIDVDNDKESPLDFALWKFAKPDEPSWPSPWGDGRPGWHTECVVMSVDLLGPSFDLHGGGIDLAFPHHENERAQALACGHDFAQHWAHNGFVEVGGEKMSKSLGNFTTLGDLIERVDHRAYRLLCLQAHYRSPIEVTTDTTSQAESTLDRLDAFARRVKDLPDVAPAQDVVDAYSDRLADDLDTVGAMVVVFETITRTNKLLDAKDVDSAAPLAAAIFHVLDAVGLEIGVAGDEIPAEVAALASERDAARANKDWAKADQVRDQLVSEGWIIEDSADGTLVRRA